MIPSLKSPWQQPSAKSTPQYFQTSARWRIQKCRDDYVVHPEKKKLVGASFSRYTSILRDKTRGEFGITYCSIARDFKTSCDRCYCEPYVHISKRPARTYTCTYIQDYVASKKIGNTHRRPKPNINCFGSSGLSSMKRSGRKHSGSSYIPGFLVSPLRDDSKMGWAKYELVARQRLHTINLPWRSHPWEYDNQDTGHFQLMRGESL